VDMNTVIEREIRSQGFQAEEVEFETLDLVRYWRAINRNRWSIIGLVAAVGVLATMVAYSLAPVYRATATLLIEPGRQNVVSIQGVNQVTGIGTREYYLTQVDVLKSRELTERLVRRLELAKHPEFDPRQQSKPWYASWLPEGWLEAGPGAASDAIIAQRVVDAVAKHTSIQPVRDTNLVRISFTSHDPELAAKVPNTLADIYITADLEAHMQMTRRAMAFLTEQSTDLRKEVAASEKALQDFRDREKIIDTKSLSLSGASKQLEDLTTALVQARQKRAEAESALNQVNAARHANFPDAVEALPAVLKNSMVQKGQEQVAAAKKKLADALKRYGPEHPNLLAAQTELRSARENLRRQIDIVVQSVAREYAVAKENEAAVRRALEQSKADIQSFNRKEFELSALEREVATNRQLYDLFMQRAKETNISSEMRSAIARVIDPAIVPDRAYGPKSWLIVGLSVFGTLLLAVALAVLLERLDNTVKSSHEVESRLEVPSVGVVPRGEIKQGQKIERLFLDDNQNLFSEAIRTIRSGVLLSALDSARKVVLVTSSIPKEGKTTIALNLALALGQVTKALLIDADMRRPTIGPMLGGENSVRGLSEFVAGEVSVEKCIYPVRHAHLWVMPSGRVPPNPLELLSSHRFANAIKVLKDVYEVIILDSPPVQLVSDALVLSRLATSVLYVVKADSTPYPLARQGLKRLWRVSAPILGAVLNQLDIGRADRYHGEYSGFSTRNARNYAYFKK
jgi:succinoglycan biosynthesis transport protein ExoP